MSLFHIGIFTMSFGSILWEIMSSLSFIWNLSGVGLIPTIFLLAPILQSIRIDTGRAESLLPPIESQTYVHLLTRAGLLSS